MEMPAALVIDGLSGMNERITSPGQLFLFRNTPPECPPRVGCAFSFLVKQHS
ncbi:MAG: Hypothetical protein BHV28_01110 [Candidatus Tokpelaia hoelldobleri]|uniref:Uncharacterized protein n=1 Tax=Candidatus Tokpelaia hoelldobleri TaxID=1902579 RepID=A0A1U9JSJ7_9HYPH|nr:MAG: Hypothetical protein BHV28_01110 [Candidatus Tokpelaia hoelldoblerii]